MDGDSKAPRARRATRLLLASAFVAVCLGPHLDRLGHPSLFTDDLTRIKDLQTRPLGDLLFRPFQEHMAPLFETVSWLTWQAAGRRLTRAPLAFTTASYLPFLISLWLLGRFLRRELSSTTTALVGVGVYSLTWLDVEAIYWYSASSFCWSLVGALAALSCASAATRTDRLAPAIGAAAASALAPAFSAIGLLAGPLGSIRIAAAGEPIPRRARLRALAPMLGTLVYLALGAAFRYHHVLGRSLEHRADFATGWVYVVCAPINVLVPGLFGSGYLRVGPAAAWNVGAAILCLAGIVARAWRSPRRGLILGGLWLVLAGYAMTYGFRAQQFGVQGLFKVERYHVFPLLGFVFWLTTGLRPWLSRYDRRPAAGLAMATAIAAVLMVLHLPGILSRSRFYDFPNQRRALASLERVDEICRREGIARGQVLAELEPIRLRWSHNANPLGMLPDSVRRPAVPDAEVRGILLAGLAPSEREALWGGMDVSPFLAPAADSSGRAHRATAGRLVALEGIRPVGGGRYLTGGWPSFLEFEWPAVADEADPAPGGRPAPSSAPAPAPALCLPRDYAACRLEVWWTGRDAAWSEARSILWQPEPRNAGGDMAVPLDHLPHWDPRNVRRVRLMFRSRTSLATVAAPRLVR